MAARRRYKTLERPKGIGDVYKGDTKLAQVSYELTVQQAILIGESSTGLGATEGLASITGRIATFEGHPEDIRTWDELTLHLEDGRKLDFSVTSHYPIGGRIAIEPSGGFY